MINAVLVAFNNPQQCLVRWERDMRRGLELTGQGFFPSVIDNSPEESPLLKDYFKDDYVWMTGKNTMYGGAINLAVARRPSDIVLYCCSRHGQAQRADWVSDIIKPLEDPQVGQSGYLMGSNSPEGVAHDCHMDWVKEHFRFVHEDGPDKGRGHVPQHVQGGVFAARTDLLLKFPYPEGLLHLYSDHWLTWSILKAGYKVVNVSTILSVWRNVVENPGNHLKYIHADNYV